MHNLCVFMGSNPGRDPRFLATARELGEAIAARGIGLVYGGAKVGLMGAVADTVLAAGGRVYGVIPHALQEKEVAHEGLTELHVVDSMHARKARMAELSDGFVALPGGFGTIEEIFEVMTWAQLGFHAKPCGFLDVDNDGAGYYAGIRAFMDTAVEQCLVHPAHRGMVQFHTTPDALLDAFAAYEPPTVSKWVERPSEL